MSLSRRRFLHTLGASGAGVWIAARGREAAIFGGPAWDTLAAQSASPIILASNENPIGPGRAVLEAIHAGFGETGRYQVANAEQVTELIARKHRVKPQNVLVGSGSTQILRTATHVFCSKRAGLVAPMPAYEECSGYAALMKFPITTVKLREPSLTMDLDPLVGAARNAGMVFFCNPNNPVATGVDGKSARDFIAAVNRTSPATTVLVDEAYFEYATMPGYETMIPLAVDNPRVIVARTFSKCHGMAGLRIGYAVGHAEAIAKMAAWDGVASVNALGLNAARAAIGKSEAEIAAESARNAEARAFMAKWFSNRGCVPTDSQTNFLFVNLNRPAGAFRALCAKQGVLVGRDFPPYEKTHCRISIGTIEDMRKAVSVFEQVLARPAAAA